ncbi:adhesion G protein-coupled receptor E1-like isoform X5 [Mauremys reevesii]|uniref:adhesion G protein-coupled receptor E1-like isoform X5 n=1 Tax=Mauremys reevesii TaxID=260615 RepID=UPI00193F0C6C|nr:adhesion G protein-coupled receptor E1-like isoform X5 [Mauremys reevesii]
MGTRSDVYPLGLCIALCLWGTVAQNHGVQAVPALAGTTEDCNNHKLCPANAKCVNSTHCTCLDGYQPRGNRFFTDTTETCDDINECLGPSPADCGLNANCIDVPGSYYCTCSDGYEFSSGKAKFRDVRENTCRVIDECQGHANCINVPGNYFCKCINGHGKAKFTHASENSCQDIDECQGPSPADCGPHANCTNVPGNYSCSCIDGYKLSSGKDNFTHASEKSCQDIDECQGPNPPDCGPQANCTNVPGSYYCTCIDGYEPSSGKANFMHASENSCQDINECLGPSPADCGLNANCIDVPGSYYCTCSDGYEFSSGKAKFRDVRENTCRDIDECQGHANCINVPGNYLCKCIDGYGKAKFTHASENSCQDIDECLGPSPADCGPHAICTNVPGNYSCSCIDGYKLSSGKANFTHASENSCRDIDECQGPSPADCGPHANCANVPGSYYCTCIAGYEPSSGKAKFTHASENSCQDIDECLGPSPADCGPHAICTNVPGNYSCSCIDGYKLSSGKANFTHASENSCQDIDECQGPSPADCGPHANCANVPGSYYCTCIAGYEPSSGKAKFTHASENSCQDIDECLGPSPADCGPHAICTNVPGNYSCSCIDGYKLSSRKANFTHASENSCQDIDECQGPSPADCGPHANCANVPGSYYCTCLAGYEPSSGKAKFTHASENSCQDIDECLGPSPADCGPHANCTNVPGNYSCSCIDGYKLSSGKAENSCQDIDECQGPSPADCGPHANCANVPGSYYCTCIAGYEPSSGKAKFTHASENSCQVPSINSSVQFVAIKETFRNFSLEGKRSGESSNFSSFLNSTFDSLMSMFGDGSATLSLENATLPFNSVLNRTSRLEGGGKDEVVSAVTFVLHTVELSTLAIALRSPERTTQDVMTESLAIQTRLVTGNCSQHSEVFTLSAHEETMVVHCDTVTGTATQAGVGAAAFISYSTLDSIISARRLSEGNQRAGGKLEKSHLNSRVVSGAIGDGRPINLSRPAKFTLRHKQAKKEEEEALCVYWKVVAENGSWSEDGCTAVHTNSTHTTCSCDHLSSFAILMAPTAVTESSPLTIITYVGLTLSLPCLFLAILTFLLCRSIRNVSTSLRLQLCLCLFLADLLFLTVVTHPGSQVVCAVIAGLLHYLFLACFSWMFLEGLHLFLTVRNLKVVNYTSASRFKKRFMFPFGYGFPALVVAISAAVNPGSYGTSEHCWLSLDRDFRWSFMGPVCAIILINITFFVLTLWILRNRLSSLNADVSTLRDHRLLTFKAIAQLFILGCSWILGLLQVGPAATVMAYLFTIVNSLQGAFIFLVHCLLNRQVTEEYRRWIRGFRTSSTKSQMSDLSMSAVLTTSTKME